MSLFSNVNLTARARNIESVPVNLKERCKCFEFFSITSDESTGISDTQQTWGNRNRLQSMTVF